MLAFAPVLAVDVGGLIAIAFMVISFIGWLSNLINGAQKPGQRPPQQQPRPRPPQNKKLRDEIESFMRDAQGKGQPKQKARPEEVLSADDITVSSTAPRQPPRQKQSKPSKSKPQAPPPPRSQPPLRKSVGQDVSQRTVETTSLGQNVKQHVSQHMAERVGAIASRDVEPTVDDTVAAHFSPFSGDAAGGRPPGPADTMSAADLLKLLRNPQGVRNALVLGEVLRPPVAMRRRETARK
jgi:hypothetical protein